MKKLALLLCLILVSCAVGPGEAIGKTREDIQVTVYPAADYKVVLSTNNVVVASANTGTDGVIKFNVLPVGAYKAVVYDSKGVKMSEVFFTSTYVSGPTPFKVSIGKVEVPAQVCVPNVISCIDDHNIKSCRIDGLEAKQEKCPEITPWCLTMSPTIASCVQCRSNGECPNDKPLCANNVCVAPPPVQVCTPNKITCKSANTKSVCNAAGTALTDTVCTGTADMCVAGKGCVECVANSDCASGNCQNNVCVPPVKQCTDSDNSPMYGTASGLPKPLTSANYPDLFVKGTTSVNGDQMTDFCNKGSKVAECRGNDCYLNEHYCYSSSQIGQKSDLICPYGCKDGACLGCATGKILCADERTVLTCNAQGFDVLTECPENARYCVAGDGCAACRTDSDCSANAKCSSVTHTCELPQYETVPLFACKRISIIDNREMDDYYVDTNPLSPCPNGRPIGILGRIISPSAPQPAGTVRLVYCYWPDKKDHLIAENFCDPVTQHRAFLGYVYKNQESGTVPLSRCVFNLNGEHTQFTGLCPAGTGWEGTWHMLPACTETDRGKDINRKGVVSTMDNSFIFKKSAVEDSCLDQSTLREFYCDTGRFDILSTFLQSRALGYEDIKCAQGCSNGVCYGGAAPICGNSIKEPGEDCDPPDYTCTIPSTGKVGNCNDLCQCKPLLQIGGQAVLPTESSGSSNVLVVFIAAFGILVVTLLNFLHKEE